MLPLWAAENLAQFPDFNCFMPEKYSTGHREHIIADPTNVSLSDSPYFYQIGKQIASLPAFSMDYLIQTLFLIWASRYQVILLHAHNYHPIEDKSILDRLCQEEKTGL